MEQRILSLQLELLQGGNEVESAHPRPSGGQEGGASPLQPPADSFTSSIRFHEASPVGLGTLMDEQFMERMADSVSPGEGGDSTLDAGMKTAYFATLPMGLGLAQRVKVRADNNVLVPGVKGKDLGDQSSSPFEYQPLDEAMKTTVVLDLKQALDL